MTIAKSPSKSIRQRKRHEVLAQKFNETPTCKAVPGEFKPIVNAQRCEGKGDCAVVCPYDVFEIVRMPDAQFSALPTLVKLKLWAHGRETALTPNEDACRACGACVAACPERAITLARVSKPSNTYPTQNSTEGDA